MLVFERFLPEIEDILPFLMLKRLSFWGIFSGIEKNG